MLAFGVSILELVIVLIPSLVIGGVLLFFALRHIKSKSNSSGSILRKPDHLKELGCLGFTGAAFLLIGLLLSISSFLGILMRLF